MRQKTARPTVPRETNTGSHLGPASPALTTDKLRWESVVLAVLARLGEGPRALAPRRDRPGDGGVAGPTHAVARARTRGDLLARDRVRIAGAVAVAPAHQIDVDVIVVMDVRARREHGGELIAGGGLHVAQEALLLRQAAPAVLHRDPASVGEREGGDVERIAEGVLGDARARIAVHAAAGIGGDLRDLGDR